jgi:hypothetical protein
MLRGAGGWNSAACAAGFRLATLARERSDVNTDK